MAFDGITIANLAYEFKSTLEGPFSVVVLGNFRRFLLVIFLFLFLHLDFSFIYNKFSMPFWDFFIEKIFLIYYNNSTP